ncbi:MAG: hypothetical protein K8S15_11310 [Candidatus Aegiribacteria sp.]|nr:hypothetical protein [Candidatus Aegiribacteria sp.]
MKSEIYYSRQEEHIVAGQTELDPGSYTIKFLTSEILPAGLYTVVIKGVNEEELIRRVVVLP